MIFFMNSLCYWFEKQRAERNLSSVVEDQRHGLWKMKKKSILLFSFNMTLIQWQIIVCDQKFLCFIDNERWIEL